MWLPVAGDFPLPVPNTIFYPLGWVLCCLSISAESAAMTCAWPNVITNWRFSMLWSSIVFYLVGPELFLAIILKYFSLLLTFSTISRRRDRYQLVGLCWRTDYLYPSEASVDSPPLKYPHYTNCSCNVGERHSQWVAKSPKSWERSSDRKKCVFLCWALTLRGRQVGVAPSPNLLSFAELINLPFQSNSLQIKTQPGRYHHSYCRIQRRVRYL